MRAVIQRCFALSVSVGEEVIGRIGPGLLVLIASPNDTEADAGFLAAKIPGLRIFDDPEGKMNLSLTETKGAVLAVSQFYAFMAMSAAGRGLPSTKPRHRARARTI